MKKNLHKQYDKDFYAWIMQNVKLLRQGKLSEIDVENIAEEIECMGKSEKRELLNRLAILMAHLLKWKFQPERQCSSWRNAIKNQRMDLNDLLKESPSLKKQLEKEFEHAYQKAILLASVETGINEKVFPKKSIFTIKDCLSSSFLPH